MKSNYRVYNHYTDFEQLAEQSLVKERKVLPMAVYFGVYRFLGYYCEQALRSVGLLKKARKTISFGLFSCPNESSQIFCWHIAFNLKEAIKIDSKNHKHLYSNKPLYCLLKELIKRYSDIPTDKEYGSLYNFSSISYLQTEDKDQDGYLSSNPSNDSITSSLSQKYDVEFVRVLNYLIEYIVCMLSGLNVQEVLQMSFAKREVILKATVALFDFDDMVEDDDYLSCK